MAAIATVAVAGLCVSFTAVFAGGAALGALRLMALTARAKARDALLAGAAYSGAVSVLAFLLFRRQINPEVTTFWRAHLLPLADHDIVSFYLDNGATAFLRAFPMQLKELAYVVPLGLFMLLRHANTRPLGLYVATLYGGALTLATLGLYPLAKVRPDLYLYPCHCLCVAAGVMLIARGRFKGLAWIFAAGTASTLIALVFNRPVRYPDRGAGRLVAVTERARRPDERASRCGSSVRRRISERSTVSASVHPASERTALAGRLGGAGLLWRGDPLLVLWSLANLLFLLIWPVKWPQYVTVLSANGPAEQPARCAVA